MSAGFDTNGWYFSAHVAANATAPFVKVGNVPFYDAPITFVVPPGGRYKMQQENPTDNKPTLWLEYSDL